MALFDTKGVFRRCPECDTAVAEDANICAACGKHLGPKATRQVGGARPPAGAPPKKQTAREYYESTDDDDDEPKGPPPIGQAAPAPRPVFGNAGGSLLQMIGASSGAGATASAAIEGFAVAFGRAFGETAVRLLGYKTGEDALDDNPFRSDGTGAGDLFKRQIYRVLFPYRTGLREGSLIALYRGLAKYADAGVGFHDALSRLEKSEKSPVMKRMLHEIRRDLLEEGSTLADAFGRHAYLLEPLHLSLIEVGESLGTVGDNMRLLVEMIEEKRALRRMIGQKLVFPFALIFIANYIMTLAVWVAGGLFMYLQTIFVPTMLIFFALCAWFVLLPMLMAAAGRGVTDRIKIELPAFGTIARANALGRFSRALGAALGAGVEIDKSLRLSAKAADNVVVQRAVEASLPLVRERGLAEGLKAAGVLPDEIAADLAHGEATGTIAPTLKQISQDARDRAARGISILASIFSFALMLLSVLYAVYSVFTKMFLAASATRNDMLNLDGGKGFDLPWKKPGSR